MEWEKVIQQTFQFVQDYLYYFKTTDDFPHFFKFEFLPCIYVYVVGETL